jgi:hypothetical protein
MSYKLFLVLILLLEMRLEELPRLFQHEVEIVAIEVVLFGVLVDVLELGGLGLLRDGFVCEGLGWV